MARVRRWPRRLAIAALTLVVLYAALCLGFELAEPNVRFGADALAAEPPRWPAGFLWGTATAAHQVEGGNTHNDWARFEAQPGQIRNGETSGRAAGHWERVAEDVQLMTRLGANAYRFSIEWSRVEPRDGAWDEAAWQHYEAEVAGLGAAGIEPMVTLLHFTLPAWLAERGGVTADDFPGRFARFAAEAARRLGEAVDLWCTVNEPNVQMYQGYVEGVWPPGARDPARAVRAFAGLLRGHAAATTAVRRVDPGARIGAAPNLIVFEPASRWSLPGWLVARTVAGGFNWSFYDSIAAGRARFRLPGFPSLDEEVPGLAGSADWIGVNYYRRNLVRLAPGAPGMVRLEPGPGPLSDTGIEIYPEGLLRLLRQAWQRYRLPLYVTENGVADAAGTRRAAFLRAHAHALRQALAEGIPLRGYFHWSLVDNFEWAEGFGPRFGLYQVDRATLARSPAPGADEFERLAPPRVTLAR